MTQSGSAATEVLTADDADNADGFIKKSCPRNTRSTPMKQKLHDKTFVPFVCLVGEPLLANLCALWWEIAAPKKSSQHATNLAYGSTDQMISIGSDTDATNSSYP
jgi:hypothetical protein